MKAIPLADKIRIESESPGDIETINLITRGKVCVLGETIGTDTHGVRRATMTIGRWGGKSEAEIAEDWRINQQRLASLEHILDAIPPCPTHGAGCIAHALAWIEKAKAVMEADE